jgi:hypothetical protein
MIKEIETRVATRIECRELGALARGLACSAVDEVVEFLADRGMLSVE